jgi:PAS domain S-box-containing protein
VVATTTIPAWSDARSPAGELGVERRFRELADHAPVLLWIAGPDSECVFFNDGWLRFTGRTMAQERGVGWAEGIHPEDFARAMQVYLEAFVARRPFEMEYRLRRHDGAYRWLFDRGGPYHHDDGSFAGFIGACVDITDARDARDDLELRRQQQAAIARLGLVALADPPDQLQGSLVNTMRGLLGAGRIELLDGVVRDGRLELGAATLDLPLEPAAPRLVTAATAASVPGERALLERFAAAAVALVAVPHTASVLLVGWSEAPRWSEHDASFASSCASLLGTAIMRRGADLQRYAMIDHLLHVRDDERRRFAREIHDQAGSSLTALLLECGALARNDDPAAVRDGLGTMREHIVSIIDDLRRVAKGLYPSLLDDLGLAGALGALIDDIERVSGLEVEVDLALDGARLPRATELTIYRVVQEALTNVVRHAGASRVEVVCRREAAALRIAVRDDGKGFVPGEREGLGLVAMRDRIGALGGTLQLVTGPARGAAIEVVLPDREPRG